MDEKLEQDEEVSMKHLEECFKEAKETNSKYVGILIEMGDEYDQPEIIINHCENFDKKLEYYKNTYDENLEHKHAKGIRIIGGTYGNSFGEIEKDFT